MTRLARRAAGVLGALALHATLVVVVTWPLATVLRTHVPGRNPDNLLLAWALAQESRALTERAPAAGIFHPTPDSLYYGEVAFGALPFFLPVFRTTGNPALALNVTYLAGIVLTALGLHLVVARWTASWLAGALAAWTVLLTPWTLRGWVRAAPTYAVMPYFPLVLYLLARPRLGRTALGLLGAALVAQGLVSPYLAAAVLAPVASVAAWRLVRPGARRDGLALAAVLLLAGAVLAWAYGGYADVWAANPRLASQSLYRGGGPPDVVRLADLDRPGFPIAVPRPCLLVILLGAFARWGRGRRDARYWRHAVLWVALGLAFTVMPIRLPRHAIDLPLTWAGDALEALRHLRAPRRLGILALFGAAALTGLGLDACVRRLPLRPGWTARGARVVLALVLAAAMIASYRARLAPASKRELLFTLAQATMTPGAVPDLDSRLVRMIAQWKGPVLELPIGPGPTPHAEAMYRAIAHRQPLVNGYDGYWPADFPHRMALACRLPDPDAVAALREATGVRLVLVHTAAPRALDRASRPPYGCKEAADRAAAWKALGESRGRPDLALVAVDGPDLLFAIPPAPPQPAASVPSNAHTSGLQR